MEAKVVSAESIIVVYACYPDELTDVAEMYTPNKAVASLYVRLVIGARITEHVTSVDKWAKVIEVSPSD